MYDDAAASGLSTTDGKAITLVADGSNNNIVYGANAMPAGAMLVFGTLGLPAFSDPTAPIHTHVVPSYLNDALTETGVPNVVTAVLASYRGYDTLGETTVVFTAGVGVIALLRRRRAKKG